MFNLFNKSKKKEYLFINVIEESILLSLNSSMVAIGVIWPQMHTVILSSFWTLTDWKHQRVTIALSRILPSKLKREYFNFVAFLHYAQSSLILCHDIKSSCILARDNFCDIIARVGLLYCAVTSNLQRYMNRWCLHFDSEPSFGPCGNKLDERCFGVPQTLYKVVIDYAITKNLLVNSRCCSS